MCIPIPTFMRFICIPIAIPTFFFPKWNANGMQSVNDVFSKVGQSVFQKFVSDKGLAVNTTEEATEAVNVTESTQYQ